jgi:hypothetical protein
VVNGVFYGIPDWCRVDWFSIVILAFLREEFAALAPYLSKAELALVRRRAWSAVRGLSSGFAYDGTISRPCHLSDYVAITHLVKEEIFVPALAAKS